MAAATAVFFVWAFLDPMHSFFPSLGAALFLGIAAAAELRWARWLEVAASERDPGGSGLDVEAAPRRGRVSRFLVIGGLIGAVLSLVVGFPLQNRHHIHRSRDLAAFSATNFELRNLLYAQEVHYGDGHDTYTDDLGALDFTPSADVTIEILAATDSGFAATATHARGMRCAIFVGDAPAPEPAAEAGVVACRE